MKKERMNKQETLALLEAYKSSYDEDVLAKLVFANMSLVRFFANKYSVYGIPFEDLESVGKIALIKAIKLFDLSRGIDTFSTYIGNAIDNEVKCELRSYKKYKDEMSLEQPIAKDKEGSELKLEDVLGTEPEQLNDEVDLKIKLEKLKEALYNLTDTEKQTIILRYGLSGMERKGLRETGKIIGVSHETIRKTEANALRKMKIFLREQNFED